jgi:hypothetical protein
MSSISLELKDGKISYRPGERISGSVKWDLDKDVKYIAINVFWYTEGIGEQDSEIAAAEKIDMPFKSGSNDFSIQLPEAPFSYSGKITSLKWAVEATTPKDKIKDVKDFTLSPDNEKIVLSEIKIEESGIQGFFKNLKNNQA